MQMIALAAWLKPRLFALAASRKPDVVIGGVANPYLRRWWIIPRNPFGNLYLHQFLRSDDDRALHDHPWASCSLLLHGAYIEHVAGGAEHVRVAGDVVLRGPRAAHRIELTRTLGGVEVPCWSLFATGPRVRARGFHCPRGWRHWRDFTDAGVTGGDGTTIGRGCD